MFLDKDNNLKLGDFGLSKAMAQAAMTQTYVGVRIYSYNYNLRESLLTIFDDFIDTVLYVA